MAYGGNITAILTLDASKFDAGIKSAVAGMNNVAKSAVSSGTGVNNLQKGMNNLSRDTQSAAGNMSKYLAEAQKANTSLPNIVKSLDNIGATSQRATTTGASGFQRLGEGISKAGQGLNQFASSFVSFDIWMAGLVGGAFLQFTVGAAAAVDRSLQLMKFVGMSSAEVERLNKSTKDYAKSAALVSQPEMLDAWRIVRLSAKLGGDQMIANNSTMGDTIALFKMQGRSATDAGRALEDAMSGNFMRFKEINIKQSDLIKAGWDGNRNNAMGFFAALQKIYQDRGIVGLANNTESVAAKFENVKEQVQLIGVEIGNRLLPTVSALLIEVLKLLSSPLGNTLVMWGISATAVGFTFALLLPIFANITLAIPRMIGMMALWRGEMTFLQATSATSMVQLTSFGGVITGLGGRIKSIIPSFMLLRGNLLLSLGVWGAVAIAIGVAAYALYDYGNKQGWFTSAQDNATMHLNNWKTKVDESKTAVNNAQKEVDKWTNIVAQSTPGTKAYAVASDNLAQAKSRLATATSVATDAEKGYNEASAHHAEVTKNYADATEKLRRETIAYKVAIGVLTPAQGELAIKTGESAAGLNNANYQIATATNSTNTYTDAVRNAGQTVSKNDPFKHLKTSLIEFNAAWYSATSPSERFMTLGNVLAVFGGIAQDVMDRFNYSTKTFTGSAVGVSDAVKNWIITPFTRAVTTIRDFWNVFVQGAAPGKATSWLKPISDAWNELKEAIRGALVAFNEGLGFTPPSSTTEGIGAWGLQVDYFANSANKAKSIIELLKDIFVNFVNAVSPPKGESAPDQGIGAWGLQLNFVGDKAESSKGAIQTIADAMHGLAVWIKEMTPYIRATGIVLRDYIIPAVTNAVIIVGNFSQAIIDTNNAIKPWLDLLWQIYHIIKGASPGIIPALKELWITAQTVWNNMVGLIQPVLTPLQKIWDILDKISKFKMPNLGSLGINLPKFEMPNLGNFKLPTPEQILGEITKRINPLNWQIPSIPSILDQTWRKITMLFWQIPSIPALLDQTWRKITMLFWQIPSPGSILGIMWNKIKELVWKIPGASEILGIIGKAIGAFRWPWGPPQSTISSARSAVSSTISSASKSPIVSAGKFILGAMTPWGPPAGPIQDFMGGLMAAKAGVNPFQIVSATNKGFRKGGVNAFTDVADAMEGHVPNYRLYTGEVYSDPQIWRNRFCNCMDGAELLLNENAKYFGMSGSMPRGWWGGWPHRWAVVGGKQFDFTNKQKHGTWKAHNDSQRSILRDYVGSTNGWNSIGGRAMYDIFSGGETSSFDQMMEMLGPTLRYFGYPGHGVDPMAALMGGGNCFDMTLGIMQMAQQRYGLPAKMVWGTYGGNSHVWANIGGKDYDLSRRALEGTYTPPPRGPKGPGAGTVIIIEGDVYGYKDFADKVEKVANGIFNNSW